MKSTIAIASFAGLAVATVASANPTLQFDINSFTAQSKNANGANSAFGGLTHTGSLSFSKGNGALAGVLIRSTPGAAFVNQGFNGAMSAFSGTINLVAGKITGGNLSITLTNGDTFNTNIMGTAGGVSSFVGGGFVLQALTSGGKFNDSVFGNVNVAQWFNTQGQAGLPGSFLQFNFNPNSSGCSSSDLDLFVDVVPLPPAAWAGLATLGGVAVARRIRRKA